ncbi:Uu.00g066760.m01.CDS01 [Anthostomella pinea]|uniref:Uu.00g066760.m01.CDS01 n=1 Tax=Anthostomella pinea TaxID=933095 RepID=A0AAI8VNF4_9PEZI|nr:Uu.00g066760.m01.CDS01 [Anthostomella pinea]
MASPTPNSLPSLSIDPTAPHQHTHTVVFLHGRGDTARDFAATVGSLPDSRGRRLGNVFPTFRWVFPQAPTRSLAADPRTSWPQWFDVWNTRDSSDNEALQAPGLRESVPLVRDILAAEAARLGGRWDRVVLAGISMGAATGAHVLLNLDVPAQGGRRLGAFLGFSCRCPFVGRSLEEMRQVLGIADGVPEHSEVVCRTPVLLEHCVDDPLVLLRNGHGMRETLRGFGAQVEWREYPSGGHWFNAPAGVDDAIAFLTEHVLETPAMLGMPLRRCRKLRPTP